MRHTLQRVLAALPFVVAFALAAPTIMYNLMAVWRGLTNSGATPMQIRDVFLLVLGPLFFQLWRFWFLIGISFILIAVIELLARRNVAGDPAAANDIG